MTWKFRYEEQGVYITDLEGKFICSVHGKTVNEEIDRGLIIAAAPKLLEGVRKAVEALNHIPRHKLPDGDSYDVAALLNALIKEATEGPL